jgi:peptidylprolyl isomerase
LDRKIIPENLDPEIGQQLELRQPDGKSLIVTVLDLKEDTVTLDGNHPLAGQTLLIDIRLIQIT